MTECEEPSIYSPAFPREKWQRKRTQVKIRVCALVPGAHLSISQASSGSSYPSCLRSAPGNLRFPCVPLLSSGCQAGSSLTLT